MHQTLLRASKLYFMSLCSKSFQSRLFHQFSRNVKNVKEPEIQRETFHLKGLNGKQHRKNSTQNWRAGKTISAAITGLIAVYVFYQVGRQHGIPQGFIVSASEEKKSKKKKKKEKHGGKKSKNFTEAIERSREICQRIKEETGSPGLTVAVSIDGNVVWKEGFGYADVENRLPCQPETIFRIASISKSITMAKVAKLWETGVLDLDKPVQFYVPSFPEKTFDGQKVTITTRQLVSHLSGIRHYYKDYSRYKTEPGTKLDSEKQSANPVSGSGQSDVSNQSKEELKKSYQSSDKSENSSDRNSQSGSKTKIASQSNGKIKKKGWTEPNNEMLLTEYYVKKNYSSVKESLEMFKNDPLVFKPVLIHNSWLDSEAAAKMPFEKCMRQLFKEFGMDNTFLEENGPLIYNRGRHYVRNNKGRLENAPYVDLSYKWAGGGMVSNVLDLVRFGNIMLYSYQMPSAGCQNIRMLPNSQDKKAEMSIDKHGKTHGGQTNSEENNVSDEKYDSLSTDQQNTKYDPGNTITVGGKHENLVNEVELSAKTANTDENNNLLAGYLKPETMRMIWEPVCYTKIDWGTDGSYGMGWGVFGNKEEHGFCRGHEYFVSHTGGAVGASSVLFILPSKEELSKKKHKKSSDSSGKVLLQRIPPQGIVVAILVNMMSVGLNKTALEIAQNFENFSTSK